MSSDSNAYPTPKGVILPHGASFLVTPPEQEPSTLVINGFNVLAYREGQAELMRQSDGTPRAMGIVQRFLLNQLITHPGTGYTSRELVEQGLGWWNPNLKKPGASLNMASLGLQTMTGRLFNALPDSPIDVEKTLLPEV